MASITANGSKGHHKFILNVSEASYSVADNTSSVSFSFQIAPIQNSWNWELWGDKISYSITINGTNYTGTIPAYDGYSTVTLKSGSLPVVHNSDGKKSISYSFSVTDSTGQTYTSGNASANGTLTLTTIPRATTPTLSATSVTMGSSVTITMTPASNTFKHKIRYTFVGIKDSDTGLSIGGGFTASGTSTATFTPPVSLGNQIPQAMSGNCTITCYTYTSAGAHIGTTTVNLTLNVPAYEPFIDSIALTGNNLLSSTYVQNKSTVTAEIIAWSSYGATITAYSSVVDGKTYTGRTFTTSALSSGDKIVKTTVTDSRGRTFTADSSNFVVHQYANPYITTFTLARQTDGTTVIATLVGGVSSVNSKNAKTFAITLNGVTKTITPSTNTVNGTATFTGVSTDQTFEAVAKITDSYTSVSKTAILPTVAVTMDFYHDGKGIAMGKVAEQTELLDVNWDGKFNKGLTVDGALNVNGLSTFKERIYLTDHLYMGGYKTATNENQIRFSNPENSTYPHDVYFFGGNPSSDIALGVYDVKNGRTVVAYRDGSHTLTIGNGSTNINFNGNKLADFVVENGSNGIWDYRKWNSGYAECWGNVSITPTTGNATNSATVNLPFAFISNSSTSYKVQITPAKTAMYIGSFGDCNASNSLSHTTTSFVMSYKYNNATPYAVSFNVTVKGKWK